MVDREIRYCTTEDGVRIAYCVEGDGPTTIIALPIHFESFSLDHMMPVYQQFYRDLGAGRRIIRLDHRGGGLSDVVSTFPDGFRLKELESVARSVGADHYVIWAPTTAGPEAIEFAVKNPDLVSHLIFYGTYAALSDVVSEDLLEGFADLAKGNWEIVTQTMADMGGRREFPDETAQLGDWYSQSQTAETFLSWVFRYNPDSRPLLSQVSVPALILHRINDTFVPFSVGQKLAAGIPNARFVPLQEKGHGFCFGDYQPILEAVDAFLGDREQAQAAEKPESVESGAFRTILFTDVEGSTALTDRLGDAKARELLRDHERITREALKSHGGSEVKTMGDGFMASFGSATKALECAIVMQRAFAERNDSATESINVRIGLNAGEPIAEDDPGGRGDLFGTAVNMAARVAAKAEGGEILASNVVRELVAGKEFLFSDRGDTELRGFEEAVRVFEVSWRE
ncbi:MAG: hypothetical protein DRI30_01400 [Chloroflexi bacterium]|nr:MAG: hypothetical protein DRI30_01400 [Chloroflexota bacterium]